MSIRNPLLIADDDPSARAIMVRILGQEYECDCVTTGPEAAALLRTKEYDLLISDIEMPGNKNLELVRDLPQLRAGLPVILMTGYPSVESAIQSVDLSVSAYLVKPFRPEQLLTEVRKAIDRYRCYKAVTGARQQLQAASEHLVCLEECLRHASQESASACSHVFPELILHTIAVSLQEWRQYAEGANRVEQCPKTLPSASTNELMSALWETVAVLEKTKVSFKSKDLGELRRKLENLLRGESPP